MTDVVARALIVWLVLAGLAVGNGVVREVILAPRMSELAAHQLSCLSLSVLILLTTIVAAPWFGVRRAPGLIGIGAFWLALTLAFEFFFGRLVARHSWARLFHDYDLLGGRLWPLVLVWNLLAPLIASRIRRS